MPRPLIAVTDSVFPSLDPAIAVLKRIDPGIKVDGLAISPRGNDQGLGAGAESVSPVRFIAALGDAYRKSGRAGSSAAGRSAASASASTTSTSPRPRNSALS